MKRKLSEAVVFLLAVLVLAACNSDGAVNNLNRPFRVNGLYYKTLQEAVNAATAASTDSKSLSSANTVYLIKDTSGAGATVTGAEVCLDFQDYTYSFTDVTATAADSTGEFGIKAADGAKLTLRGTKQLTLYDKDSDLVFLYVDGKSSVTVERQLEIKLDGGQYAFWVNSGVLTIGSDSSKPDVYGGLILCEEGAMVINRGEVLFSSAAVETGGEITIGQDAVVKAETNSVSLEINSNLAAESEGSAASEEEHDHSSHLDEKGRAATCTERGYREIYCAVCGEVMEKNFTGTAPHTLVHTEALEAGCETKGNTEYWTCSVCGQYFSDKDGTNQIEKDSWITPELRHDYSKTDKNESSHWKVCSRCDAVTSIENHSFYYDSDDSSHHQICSECRYKTDPVEHTWTGTVRHDEKGHWTYYLCDVCKYEKDGEVSEHDFEHTSYLEEEGVITGFTTVCTAEDCGYESTETVTEGAALGLVVYTSFEKALSNISADTDAGSTIVLFGDTDLASNVEISSDIELNLNGKVLYLGNKANGNEADGHTITVNRGATLKVTGTGKIVNDCTGYTAGMLVNQGTLSLEGVSVSYSGVSGFAVNNSGGTDSAAVLKLDGAAVICDNQGGTVTCISNTLGDVTVSGASVITCAAPSGAYNNGSALDNNSGNIEVKGNKAVVTANKGAIHVSTGTVTVEGGTFNGPLVVSGGTLQISGGSFTADPTGYLAAGHDSSYNSSTEYYTVE